MTRREIISVIIVLVGVAVIIIAALYRDASLSRLRTATTQQESSVASEQVVFDNGRSSVSECATSASAFVTGLRYAGGKASEDEMALARREMIRIADGTHAVLVRESQPVSGTDISLGVVSLTDGPYAGMRVMCANTVYRRDK